MSDNGSPAPTFTTDKRRTYFLVELPIQPKMKKAQVKAQVALNDTQRKNWSPLFEMVPEQLTTLPLS
jgi:hypothetical protein